MLHVISPPPLVCRLNKQGCICTTCHNSVSLYKVLGHRLGICGIFCNNAASLFAHFLCRPGMHTWINHDLIRSATTPTVSMLFARLSRCAQMSMPYAKPLNTSASGQIDFSSRMKTRIRSRPYCVQLRVPIMFSVCCLFKFTLPCLYKTNGASGHSRSRCG